MTDLTPEVTLQRDVFELALSSIRKKSKGKTEYFIDDDLWEILYEYMTERCRTSVDYFLPKVVDLGCEHFIIKMVGICPERDRPAGYGVDND